MIPDRNRLVRLMLPFATVLGCYLSVLFMPAIALALNDLIGFIPRFIVNLLFFAPQLIFPYFGIVLSSHTMLEKNAAIGLSLLQCLIVATAFSFFTRRIRSIIIEIFLSYLAIVGVAAILLLLLKIFHVDFELDGP